jgi:hypothetical protein
VQLWFGEFIHGVLEEAFRRYKESVDRGRPQLPPWGDDEVEKIRALIKARLRARGLYAWDEDLEKIGDARAKAAIEELGPHLFPLIRRAEVRLYGARMLPKIPKEYEFREADRYEMVGVVDVVTNVELSDKGLAHNPVVKLMVSGLVPMPTGKFEVIVDYKGMRRPPNLALARKGALWDQYAWQVQTYAELRRKQPDALKVAAGVLLYVNELSPTSGDLEQLKTEIKNGWTDVVPPAGSEAEGLLKGWSPGKPLPTLPLEFRLARALRVVPVSQASVDAALSAFDGVVQNIELCRGREAKEVRVIEAWQRNSEDESTCVVCDSRTFCPDYQTKYAKRHGETHPRIPGVRAKK